YFGIDAVAQPKGLRTLRQAAERQRAVLQAAKAPQVAASALLQHVNRLRPDRRGKRSPWPLLPSIHDQELNSREAGVLRLLRIADPEHIAQGYVLQAEHRRTGRSQKMRQLAEAPFHLAKEAKCLPSGGPNLRREIQEVPGHCFGDGFVQCGARRLEQIGGAGEVDGANRKQLVNMPWRKLPGLVIGKSTRRAVVAAVTQFASDDACPLGRLPEGNSASFSGSLNELTGSACRRHSRKRTWHPVALQRGRNYGLLDYCGRANFNLDRSQSDSIDAQSKFDRRIGKLSGTQDDRVGF